MKKPRRIFSKHRASYEMTMTMAQVALDRAGGDAKKVDRKLIVDQVAAMAPNPHPSTVYDWLTDKLDAAAEYPTRQKPAPNMARHPTGATAGGTFETVAGDDTGPEPEPAAEEPAGQAQLEPAAAPERDPEPEPEQSRETPSGTPPMIYNGIAIRDRDGKLNLTDMWKAAGSDLARQPANWLASADAKRFQDFLAEIHDPGNSGDLVETTRGRYGETWAHWQLGIAYAKYLSPGFHAWCNQVVRDRMDGKIGRPEELEARIRAEVEAELRGKLASGPTKRELGAQTAAILRDKFRAAEEQASERARRNHLHLDLIERRLSDLGERLDTIERLIRGGFTVTGSFTFVPALDADRPHEERPWDGRGSQAEFPFKKKA